MSPEDFAQLAPIQPESLNDYRNWQALLEKWNARINLVAPKSLADFWRRHALDSAQLAPLIPRTTTTIVDFGSGAGFPGLAVAIQAKHREWDQTVHLIESAGKKASFLKSVSRETDLNTVIHAERIEAVKCLNADIITARAFAPLHRLLPLAALHLRPHGKLILLKGASLDAEITEARRDWEFETSLIPSLSDESGVIVTISKLSPR